MSKQFFARLSIEQKLPLLMGGLLLGVIIALAGAAYAEVRRSSLRIASERLTSVTAQFRDLFEQSGAQRRTQLAVVASKPALLEYARTRSPSARAAALAELRAIATQPEAVVATELRDSTGAIILSTAAAGVGVDTMPTRDVLPRTEPGDSAVIGGYRWLRDTMVYAVVAPVQQSANAYVVRWRRIAGSARAREQITHLIGSDASLFLGNADGERWTDLESAVPRPPVNLAAALPVQSYERGPDRQRYLASAARVPGTPWAFAIDFPVRNVMAPVDVFMRRIVLIGAVALALGLFAAWLVSRRISDPLRQLTDASLAVAGGNYGHTLRIDRSDELGQLGHAFATMASDVQNLREGLERKVDERTRDLNDTLRQLHDAQETNVRKEKLAILGQLASGVGHELRNPLGVMTNAVYFLRMVLASSPKNVHEYLDILQQQITLSEKIVGDLLDFARLKQPRRKPASVLEVTRLQISRLGAANGTKIDTEVPPNIPAVLVDDVHMGQIILNLLTNAMQAMDGEGGGRITIRVHAAGDNVHYDVTDTGPGIKAENMDKIFEPLFTTKARGIGLGLAVSRTLARANGGDLTVTSAPGAGGATFRLTLPVATESAA